MSHRVLITDRVDPICLELLEAAGMMPDYHPGAKAEDLPELAAEAEGWIVRSGTKVTAGALADAPKLKVVGRAGVGVDNVDREEATRHGVLVLNAPDGNTTSTAEHACALMMAVARQLPQAHASLKEGAWARKQFQGSELYGKTLGIIGVGKVGGAVAERMKAFGMHVIGYDPVLSEGAAARLGVELVDLDALCSRSDIITIHAPLNSATRGLLDAERLATCKKGVLIVNAARGGIVDEEALLGALESEQVGGAALDVYSQEPPPEELRALVEHPRVVATPHIAASTDEAQAKVAQQVTEQVIAALRGEPVQTAVNALAIGLAAEPDAQPFLLLADRLGQVAGQIAEGPIRKLVLHLGGEAPQRYADAVRVAALRGVLHRLAPEPVNLINAPVLARERGLDVEEHRTSGAGSYAHTVGIEVEAGEGIVHVTGAVFGERDVRLVEVDGFPAEVRLEGHLLFYRNPDRPGILAAVGQVLAQDGVNVGALALGRTAPGADALTVLTTDEVLSEDVLARVAAVEGLEAVRTARLGDG